MENQYYDIQRRTEIKDVAREMQMAKHNFERFQNQQDEEQKKTV